MTTTTKGALPFVCSEPGCTAAYKLPQHLGLHRYHKHGISSARKKAKAKAVETPKRKYTARPKLTAGDICLTVLNEVAPQGRIPVTALHAYTEWVSATEAFLHSLNGKTPT